MVGEIFQHLSSMEVKAAVESTLPDYDADVITSKLNAGKATLFALGFKPREGDNSYWGKDGMIAVLSVSSTTYAVVIEFYEDNHYGA